MWRELRQWARRRRNRRLRRIDVDVLWPVCRELTSNLDHARAAFARHALRDYAWKDLSEAEITALIDGMK